jgi:magnesium-protoporphyrin IX monomethyl ester (oxidative) cyclase
LCYDPGSWEGIKSGGGGLVENSGLGCIAAVAQEAGHDVQMWQVPLNNITEDRVLERATECDVVAVSCMAYNADRAIRFAQQVRELRPEIRLITGGAGPSGMPEYFLPHFNAVVVGEGEQAFRFWLEGKVQDGIIKSPRNMRWDGQPFAIHNPEVMKNSRMCGAWPIPVADQILVSAEYGRGCPNNCWFCSTVNIMQRKVCWRSAESVAEELEQLIQLYGVNSVDFTDPTFGASRRKVLQLCEEFKCRGLDRKLSWFVTTDLKPRSGTAEMFAAMRETGCIKVGFGLEDPSAEARQSLDKGNVDIDDCREVMQQASDADLLVRTYLMLGTPDQDEASIENIKKVLQTWPIDELRVAIFCPFPGTRAWTDLQEQITVRDLAKYDTNCPVIASHWSDEDLVALRQDLLRMFYGSANYQYRRDARISSDPRYQNAYSEFETLMRRGGYI